jgi:hypothetical protein
MPNREEQNYDYLGRLPSEVVTLSPSIQDGRRISAYTFGALSPKALSDAE